MTIYKRTNVYIKSIQFIIDLQLITIVCKLNCEIRIPKIGNIITRVCSSVMSSSVFSEILNQRIICIFYEGTSAIIKNVSVFTYKHTILEIETCKISAFCI